MAFQELESWDDVPQWNTTMKLLGGDVNAPLNAPLNALVHRTAWLKAQIAGASAANLSYTLSPTFSPNTVGSKLARFLNVEDFSRLVADGDSAPAFNYMFTYALR